MIRALALSLLLSSIAQADSDRVTVRASPGDTFDIIAAEYYGDRKFARFIVEENRVQKARPLRNGERVRVPITREVTTEPGDTFQSLAQTLLGDTARSEFLAELNGVRPDDNLTAGTALLVPFTISHTAAAVEPFESMVKTYYGRVRDPAKYVDALRRYNKLDATKLGLEKGEKIMVPSFDIKVHPAKYPAIDAESRARREKRTASTASARDAIPAARVAWRTGDYATVRKVLTGIDVAYVDPAAAIQVGVLLGCAHIALDETEPGLAAFRAILDRQPTHTLRKLDHSPKILAVWTKAGGSVE